MIRIGTTRTVRSGRSLGLALGLAIAAAISAPAQSPPALQPPAAKTLTPAAEGTLVGGNRIKLTVVDPTPGTKYLWKQLDGPPVPLVRGNGADAGFVAPDALTKLRFAVVATTGDVADVAEIVISVQPAPVAGVAGDGQKSGLRADAGDDQLGVAGRQITLNGMRSEPKGSIGYRWIQVAGPPVALALEDRYFYSFIAASAGEYRFALVVAKGSEISPPDFVTVSIAAAVGATPHQPKGGGPTEPHVAPKGGTSTPMPLEPGTKSLPELAKDGLSSVDGVERAERLADAFVDTAGRMDLYRTYGDAYVELSRRLEEILPKDPAARQKWVDVVFEPLTKRLVDAVRSEGLELATVQGQSVPLTAAQRDTIGKQLREIGEGFRAVAPSVASKPGTSAPK